MGNKNPTQTDVQNDFGSAGMNCKSLRLDAKASDIEPTQGTFNWSATDGKISTLVNAGVGANVVLCVTGGATPPAWMCSGYPAGIPNPDLFDDFFFAVMDRYSKAPYNVKFFEVYNEANYQFTELVPNDHRSRANHYFLILQKAWNRTATLRSANPAIKVIGGVTAGAPISKRASDNDFFDQFWNVKGGWQYLNYYSFHLYIRGADVGGSGYVAPEFQFGNPNRGLLWTDILVPSSQVNWHSKEVWLTELGYDSADASMGGTQTIRWDNQARWQVRAAIIMRGAPTNFIKRFLQFNAYWDDPVDDEAYGFREGVNGTKKPQWHAWKTLNSVIDDTVTNIEMKAYYQVTSPTTNICNFKYTKSNGYYGWAVWWVPAGGSGTVYLGSGAVTGAVYTRTMKATSWTFLGNYSNQSVQVTATNDPLYVEVR